MSDIVAALERLVTCVELLRTYAKKDHSGSSHRINAFVTNVFVSNAKTLALMEEGRTWSQFHSVREAN